jgi:hypothetical protein
MAMWALANAEQQATAKMEGILWGGRVWEGDAYRAFLQCRISSAFSIITLLWSVSNILVETISKIWAAKCPPIIQGLIHSPNFSKGCNTFAIVLGIFIATAI